MSINNRGLYEGEVASHSTHEATDNRCLFKDDEKIRNSPRNSSGVFAKTECSKHVPRASEQALQVIGPYCSYDGIEKDCSVNTLLPLLFF